MSFSTATIPNAARTETIALPAALVEDLVRIQAEELQRLRKQLEEAQTANSQMEEDLRFTKEELYTLINSASKVGLNDALGESESVKSIVYVNESCGGSPLSPKSALQPTNTVAASDAYSEISFVDDISCPDSDFGQSDGFELISNQGSEMSLMETLATQSLEPFSYKPWPHRYIKTLKQLGTLKYPFFYPGNEMVMNFADRRAGRLVTVMHCRNNKAGVENLHQYFENFGLKTWVGSLMIRHDTGWYYLGTYRTTGYETITGEQFDTLSEKAQHAVYVQATHAISIPKVRQGKSSKCSGGRDIQMTSKPNLSKQEEGKRGRKKEFTKRFGPSIAKELKAQISEGRVELASITFSLIGYDEDVQRQLEQLEL